MENKRKLNVLFLPSWYPNDSQPVNGIFNREYAKAVKLRHNAEVLYLTSQPQTHLDYNDEGIRTIKHGLSPFGTAVKRRLGLAKRRLQGLLRRRNDVAPKPAVAAVAPVTHTTTIKPSPIYYATTLLTLTRYLWHGLRQFSKLRREFRPDILHVQVIYPAGLLGWAISRRYRIPMVLSENSNPFSMHLTDPLRSRLVRGLLRRFALISPVSHSMQRTLEGYGASGPFVVIPNVVNTDIFAAEVSQPQQAEVKKMLIVAILSNYKGYPYLLQALALLKQSRNDFSLDIVGDGERRAEYEQMVDELGLRDMVTFHGLKSKAEVARMMQDCDFLVISSLSEGLVVVMLEALASGKPVLSTRWTGVEDAINERVGHLVAVADVEALHDGLDWMLDHYHEFDAAGIAQYARDRYSYAAVAAQFDAIYRRVLEET